MKLNTNPLKGKRHTAHIWISKEGLVSINDRLFAVQDVAKIMYEKRVSDPQLVVSLKADEEAKMELISSIHEEPVSYTHLTLPTKA